MDLKMFNTEVLPLKGRLYRLALGYLKDSNDAEDAVQEVFVKLWHMRSSLSKYRSIEALAVTITKNHCLDQLKAKRRSEVSLDRVVARSGGKSPAHYSEINDLMGVLQNILPELPEQQQLVFQMRDVEGLELREIEEITGINYNNIRVVLSRARKALREKLIKIQDYEYNKDTITTK